MPKPKPSGIFGKRYFTTAHVREAIDKVVAGDWKGISLNHKRLNTRQRNLLEKAGWRKMKIIEGRFVWMSPRQKKQQ